MMTLVLSGFKLNLNNILTSHIIGYSVRQKVFKEVLDNVDVMKHLFTIDIHHLDFFYGSFILFSVIYYFNDLQYKNSFNNLESNKDLKKIIKNIELLLLILIFLLTKNIENAI